MERPTPFAPWYSTGVTNSPGPGLMCLIWGHLGPTCQKTTYRWCGKRRLKLLFPSHRPSFDRALGL
jgi:hypothetical protein